MKRQLLAATIFSVGFASLAAAQEKVQFPSTDADLHGGSPTELTGYLRNAARRCRTVPRRGDDAWLRWPRWG
jgi:hypothetical protein